MSLGVALSAPFNRLKLSAVTIRDLLLADVLADLLQFEPDRRNGIPARPEMLAREIPFLAIQPSNGNCTFSLEEPDHGGHRMLGRNGDAHVHMIWHQVPFKNLAFLLPRQSVENLPQLTAGLPEDCFPPPFGHEHHVVLCSPIWNGIGSGKALTLNPPYRWSSSHLRRIILPERSNLFKSHWSNQWLAH